MFTKDKPKNADPVKPEAAQSETTVTNTESKNGMKKIDPAVLMPHDLGDDQVLDNVFEQLKEGMIKKTLTEATSDYLRLEDFKDKEERRYIFLNISKMEIENKNTGETKEIEVAQLLDENRQRLCCGAAVVVSSLKKVDKIPCGIIIRVEGKRPGKDYYNARVFILK